MHLPDNVPFVERQQADPYISKEQIDSADRYIEARWRRKVGMDGLHDRVRRVVEERTGPSAKDADELTS